MKKQIAILLLIGVGIVLLIRFVFTDNSSTEWSQVYRQYVPHDPNFTPVIYGTYQPPSVPMLSSKKSGLKLPEGMSEKDVAKVTTIERTEGKPIDIIETKSGEIFIAKDSTIRSVRVTMFEAPVFSFDWRFGFGASLGYRERFQFSPSVTFAPLEWYGKLHAPTLTADLDGIGVGGQLRVYHDIYLGPAHVWRYDVGSQFKATVHYMF